MLAHCPPQPAAAKLSLSALVPAAQGAASSAALLGPKLAPLIMCVRVEWSALHYMKLSHMHHCMCAVIAIAGIQGRHAGTHGHTSGSATASSRVGVVGVGVVNA
mmetsp:Transcript_40423/g.120577  ORF Transcript_40423/g.120577 Transcript_40423/m.120577 type:complete len:104 (-) Transcript_40423:521-832(-)